MSIYAIPRYYLDIAVEPDNPEDLTWQDSALCAQVDAEIFFPEKGGSVRMPKLICSRCPVREPCLEYALDNDERFGVWGGMTERARRRLQRQRAATATTPLKGAA